MPNEQLEPESDGLSASDSENITSDHEYDDSDPFWYAREIMGRID